MLTDKTFYIGLLVGALLYYVYANHLKKGPASG
jgi:hypothetical protein